MLAYNKIVNRVLETGTLRHEPRTDTNILSTFGLMFEHDLSEGFPLLTGKKMAIKPLLTELEWFIHGRTDLRWLLERGNKIWLGDAFKRFGKDYADFLEITTDEMTIEKFADGVLNDSEFFYEDCDLGPIYGAQWRGTYSHGLFTPPDQLKEVVTSLMEAPTARRHLVVAWNPLELHNMVLPPCWTSGSLVNKLDGTMDSIENISIGDRVLTYDGSYQSVYDKMITEYNGDIYSFKLFGSRKNLKVTPNHPFLVKDKGFVEAKDICNNDYLAIPINKNSIIPEFTLQIKDNQYSSHLETFSLEDNDYWYLMGYFLGDGWLQRSKEEIYFVVADKDKEKIVPILKRFIGLAELHNSGQNCTKFVGKKQMDFYILSFFGNGASDKTIPDFVHDAPVDKIKSFIDGYCDADGHIGQNRISYTTTSDNIAYSLQRLYAKIGIKASVYFQERPQKTTIDNRVVNQKNTYSINVESGKNFSSSYVFDENYLWLKIDTIEVEKNIKCNVYNLSIENNHTYCVNNIINHNCHYAFQFYVRWDTNGQKFLDMMYHMRSNDIALGGMTCPFIQ